MARSFASFADRRVKSAAGMADSRTKLLRAIRAAANDQKLSDEQLRDIYESVGQSRSAKDFNLSQLGQILDRLNKDRKGPMGHHPHVGKVKALWWSLYWLGEVRCDTGGVNAALDAFVKRQAKVDALRFLSPREAHSVIEALKAMLARAGVKWVSPDEATTGLRDQAALDREAVAQAIWQRLREKRAVFGITYYDYVLKALHLGLNHHLWTAQEQDAVIRLLGKKLRKVAQLPGGERDD